MSIGQKMTSCRSYLVKALNEWIIDNNMTSYIVVNALEKNVEVPRQYEENGKIVLNISPVAVQGLSIDNENIMFAARFSGASMNVFIPMTAVLAIYAKENGQGMVFTQDIGDVQQNLATKEDTTKSSKPHLKLVT